MTAGVKWFLLTEPILVLRENLALLQHHMSLIMENLFMTYGARQANLVLIAYASSEGSDKPAHPRSLARTSAARSYKQCQEEPSDRKPDPWSL